MDYSDHRNSRDFIIRSYPSLNAIEFVKITLMHLEQPPPASTQFRPLFRSDRNRVIAGVCGGLGIYFGIDPTVIRVLWVIFSVIGGPGLMIYLVLWLIIPSERSLQKDLFS